MSELSVQNFITCHICKRPYGNLVLHLTKSHQFSKSEISHLSKALGRKTLLSKRIQNIYNSRKISEVKLIGSKESKFIRIPSGKWPEDCEYARVDIKPDLGEIHFLPCTKPSRRTKPVKRVVNSGSEVVKINIPTPLAETLLQKEAYFTQELNNPHGFVINVDDELETPNFSNESIFVLFRKWLSSSHGTNKPDLIIYPQAVFSIEVGLWPLADRVYFESGPKNFYLDLFPIGPSGKIVLPNGQLGRSIEKRLCLKLTLNHKRLTACATNFFKENHLEVGNSYKLYSRNKDGRLRFKLIED